MGWRDIWGDAADRLDPIDNPWSADPVGWVRDRLGEHLWSKQRDIAASVSTIPAPPSNLAMVSASRSSPPG